MKNSDISAMEQEVIRLREENAQLRMAQSGGMNPLYRELIDHLIAGPKTISQLAELMARDNRTISQWLHQVKTRFSARIITLSHGEKQLENPALFEEKQVTPIDNHEKL